MANTPVRERRKWIDLVVLLGVSMVGMFALSAIALVIWTNAARPPQTIVLEIPDGTAELIAAGENPLGITDPWAFQADDILVLDNRDRVRHYVGPLTVEPGDVVQAQLQLDDDGLAPSTLHPSGIVNMAIEFRNFSFALLVYPTVGFGLSVGLILWIGLQVMRSLDEEPDLSEYLGTKEPDTEPQ